MYITALFSVSHNLSFVLSVRMSGPNQWSLMYKSDNNRCEPEQSCQLWLAGACRGFHFSRVGKFYRENFLATPGNSLPPYLFSHYTWGCKEFTWGGKEIMIDRVWYRYMIGWKSKDLRWGSKVRCNSWVSKVRCTSAAKNHPSARLWWLAIKEKVTFLISLLKLVCRAPNNP